MRQHALVTLPKLLPLVALRLEAARPAYRRLATGTAMLIIALDHRMNSNTVIATIPPVGSSREPAVWLARWLDDGAPGLAAAAEACEWAETLATIVPGEAPSLRPLSHEAFVARIDWLLTSSWSFYDHVLAEPVAVRDAFIDAELGRRADAYCYYEVDVPGLAPRVSYFDGFPNDACLVWTDGEQMRVLFTNGSD